MRVNSQPKQTCIDCHFFVKGSNPHKFHPTDDERTRMKAGDFSTIGDHWSLACHKGIWDEGYRGQPEKREEIILRTSRENSCFFYPYTPGMNLPAAVKLQEISRTHEQGHVRDSQSDRTSLRVWNALRSD